MLPTWNPDRLAQKIPFNLALVGGRRMGKSSAVSDLLMRMRSRFDLIIAFIGSANCNPVLQEQMIQFWDDRFFFSKWEDRLIETLLVQQEELKRQGKSRSILILMDDVVLTSEGDEQLAHMAMRGRHFQISLAMCSVSYTSLPKRARRSLDCLLVFSLPMQSDMKVLTWEYTQKAKMARFILARLGDYECLVLETLQKKQELFVWTANYVTVHDLRKTQKSLESPEHDLSKNESSDDSASEHPPSDGRAGKYGPPNRTQYGADPSQYASGRIADDPSEVLE